MVSRGGAFVITEAILTEQGSGTKAPQLTPPKKANRSSRRKTLIAFELERSRREVENWTDKIKVWWQPV